MPGSVVGLANKNEKPFGFEGYAGERYLQARHHACRGKYCIMQSEFGRTAALFSFLSAKRRLITLGAARLALRKRSSTPDGCLLRNN